MVLWRKQPEHVRTVISKRAESCCGIREITYSEGDFRESPGYNIVFFRDDKLFCVYFDVGSAEVLFDLLGIDKSEVEK